MPKSTFEVVVIMALSALAFDLGLFVLDAGFVVFGAIIVGIAFASFIIAPVEFFYNLITGKDKTDG